MKAETTLRMAVIKDPSILFSFIFSYWSEPKILRIILDYFI